MSLFGKKILASVLIASVFLGGCSSIFPRDALVPDLPKNADRQLTAIDATNDVGEIELNAGFDLESAFVLSDFSSGGRLPNKKIKGVQVAEGGLYDTIQLLLAGTGLSLTVEGGPNAMERYGAVATYNLAGDLTEVMDQLSEAAGFFYTVEGRHVQIASERLFVMKLPPVTGSDSMAGIVNTLQYMGAKDVWLDRPNSSLTFSATRTAAKKISNYIDRVRETRSMISYEMEVYQVDLNDDHSTGIGWSTAGFRTGANSALSGGLGTSFANLAKVVDPTTGVVGAAAGLNTFAAQFVTRNISIDAMVNFLKTQGTVKTVSRPRIAVMNGAEGSFRVGETAKYISKVTRSVTATSGTTGGDVSYSTEVSDLKTGFAMMVRGDYHDRTVYTKIEMTIADLVKMVDYQAGEGTNALKLKLPNTIDREVKTAIRARPGDLILLGGLTFNRNSQVGNGGLSGVGRNDTVEKSELVIAIRPRVVLFSSKAMDKAVAPSLVN